MASAITHFIVAGALALPATESRNLQRVLPRWAIPISCGIFGVFPDFDAITMRIFDIPYQSFLGHRGFFHSPFFLILFAAVVAALVGYRRERGVTVGLAAIWSAAAITHPLLDMLTDGGAGVMLLFPFSNDRVFFPWHPIHVSPLEISRFADVAGYVLRSELPFCIAAVTIGGAAWMAVRFRSPDCVRTAGE
jgi:inner membrane protein